jgi:hypothetical protein
MGRHGIRWGERVFIHRDSLPQIVRSLIESPESELAEVLPGLQPEATRPGRPLCQASFSAPHPMTQRPR